MGNFVNNYMIYTIEDADEMVTACKLLDDWEIPYQITDNGFIAVKNAYASEATSLWNDNNIGYDRD